VTDDGPAPQIGSGNQGPDVQSEPLKPIIPESPASDTGIQTEDSGPKAQVAVADPKTPSASVRLTAENLNRLLGLAGESLVESRWLRPFTEAMQRLKRMQMDQERVLDQLRTALSADAAGGRRVDGTSNPEPTIQNPGSPVHDRVSELIEQASAARDYLGERLQELDLFDRRSAHLSKRLYLEVLRARMRPFSDGAHGFPRMVRDVARGLGKRVRLEIIGDQTQVDRDILDRLEAPLSHLLRNAVDHGCELPEDRERAGKSPEATVRLEARHNAGMLQIVVSDDGAGVDVARVRRAIKERKLASAELADRMGDSELLQFLFLPGFTLREAVTEISGRGVGLDIVHNLVKGVRGTVRVSTESGRGTKFVLQLPLTLSVLRTLLVSINGEPYAIPLAQIVRIMRVTSRAESKVQSSKSKVSGTLDAGPGTLDSVGQATVLGTVTSAEISTIEGRMHFRLGEEQIGLVSAREVLGMSESGVQGSKGKGSDSAWSVVVLGEGKGRYGLVVD
jgi:two-component system sensor histidine kinase and response regulator WspE